MRQLEQILAADRTDRRPLEQVVADWREEAKIFRKRGIPRLAKVIEQLLDDVCAADGIEEHMRWISEEEAMLRSGRSLAWLRAQFPDWEQLRYARRDGKKRQYRMFIVPRRPNIAAAAAAGRQAAHA